MNIALMEYYRELKGYTYEKIAELSGIAVGTVRRMFAGETGAPDHETLRALEKVLKPDKYGNTLHEAQTAYRAEKRAYTLADYYALPKEQRVDIERRKVIVYFFEKDCYPVIYGMKDKIPAGICDGELQIDLRMAEEALEEIYHDHF